MLDDSKWPDTERLIDAACGITNNTLVVGDGPNHDFQIGFVGCYEGCQHPHDVEREYQKIYYPIDERVPRARQLPDGHLAHIRTLYTAEELKTSPTYNEMMPRVRQQDSLNVRLDGRTAPTSYGAWAIPRGPTGGILRGSH